ncbi:hypothetical protein P3T76_015955 [Phytophthora citrophthora]|uniref:Uncharacterized protein n=1 Tax=Phytophthora citrophthora TaxID=4793 RepID=A0AAD9FYG9_9STRA|nr:hypothetical protein P3T76_015955 [Phytophthora citrophthora]
MTPHPPLARAGVTLTSRASRHRQTPPPQRPLGLNALMLKVVEEMLQDMDLEVHVSPTPAATGVTVTAKPKRWSPHPRAVAAAAIARLVTC